jgi:Arc/MetJ-type ribon-helix-helix transcriptional regulator
MTKQIALRLPDEMLAKLDEYVSRGKFENRTAAVREAIQALIDDDEERQIAEEYRRAYTEQPEDPAVNEAFTKLAAETMEPW